MTSQEILALAEDFRWFALQTGRDLNAANLFAHNMLMQTLLNERGAENDEHDEAEGDLDEFRAA